MSDFFYIERSKKTKLKLLLLGFSKQVSCIENRTGNYYFLVNNQNKTFWLVCENILNESRELILESYNQNLEKLNNF